jgi:hypothetical protein
MLGPLGIRYVVLAERAAPERTKAERFPLPAGLVATMTRQLDLRRIEVDPAITLFENTGWVPVRAHLAAGAALGGNALRASAATDLASAADPVLTTSAGPVRYRGDVPSGTVLVADAASSRWELSVAGQRAPRTRTLGWANGFDVARAGSATLRYRTSPLRWLAVLVQAVLWLVAVLVVVDRPLRRRRRHRRSGA